MLSHFALTALKSHGNPNMHNDLVELKIKQDLPVSWSLMIILPNH